jgi:transposase
VAALPAPLRPLCPPPGAATRGRPHGAALPPGLAFAGADLAARVTAVQARIATTEAELVRVAAPLPAYRLLDSVPGVGPTIAAILLAEIGDIAWYTQFSQLRKLAGLDILRLESGQWRGTPRISKCGRPLLRWALYQAAMGACRNAAWRARREAWIAKRRGDRFAFFKATTELAAKLLRLVWGVWRSGRPYDPARVVAPPPQGPTPVGEPRTKPVGRRAAPRPSGRGARVTAR